MKDDCIFCDISEGKIKSNKIYENNSFFSIFDINPALEGHAIVISKKHYETFFDVPEELGKELLDCINKTSEKLEGRYNAEGFNIIANVKSAGGQIINHFHLHILPRKKSDNAILKFIDKHTGKSAELKDKIKNKEDK